MAQQYPFIYHTLCTHKQIQTQRKALCLTICLCYSVKTCSRDVFVISRRNGHANLQVVSGVCSKTQRQDRWLSPTGVGTFIKQLGYAKGITRNCMHLNYIVAYVPPSLLRTLHQLRVETVNLDNTVTITKAYSTY